MKFGFGITSTLDNVDWITDLSEEISNGLSEIDFGNGILDISIGIICVRPEFEKFFSIPKPSFIHEPETVFMHGQHVTFKNSLSFSLKLDYDEVINNDNFENKKLLASQIVSSFNNFQRFTDKISNFDFINFRKTITDILSKYL